MFVDFPNEFDARLIQQWSDSFAKVLFVHPIDFRRAMTSKTTNKFSPEVRARAVRMVLDHASDHPSRWAAVTSIAAKIGCTPQTLHDWVKKAEVDSGRRAGVPTDMADKLKALERENRELRQANEILRKASAYFATAELDRRYKP